MRLSHSTVSRAPKRLAVARGSRMIFAMSAMKTAEDLALQVTRLLVENPDSVQVESSTTGSATVLLLKVAKEDLGRVIGKNGRTIDAIRVVLSAIAARQRHQIVFDVRDAGASERTSDRPPSSPLRSVRTGS